MIRLRRYLWWAVLLPSLAVLGTILALDLLFSFVAELDNLRGDYGIPQPLQYLLTTAPRRVHGFLPMAVLLGTLIGLGVLASSGELTVMRAAGVSPLRITGMALRPALLLLVCDLMLAEYVVPYLEQVAQSNKALAMGRGEEMRGRHGYWHREGDEFIHIQAAQPNGVLHGVTRYRFAGNELVDIQFIERAIYQGKHWFVEGVQGSALSPDAVRPYQSESEIWTSTLTPELLSVLVLSPDNLALSRLYSYAAYLSEQGLQPAEYLLAFWQKLLIPVATFGMVLVASAVMFGPLRQVTMGLRLTLGIMAGMLFHYGQQIFGHISLVFGISPLVAAGLPPAICLLAGLVLLWRMR